MSRQRHDYWFCFCLFLWGSARLLAFIVYLHGFRLHFTQYCCLLFYSDLRVLHHFPFSFLFYTFSCVLGMCLLVFIVYLHWFRLHFTPFFFFFWFKSPRIFIVFIDFLHFFCVYFTSFYASLLLNLIFSPFFFLMWVNNVIFFVVLFNWWFFVFPFQHIMNIPKHHSRS